MISNSGSPFTETSSDSVDVGEIPCGTYHLEFGSNFLSNIVDSEYHTLKFDIKPPAFNGSALFTFDSTSLKLTIPTDDAEGHSVYRGPVTNVKNGKECLLLFDGENVRLEKVSTTMTAKHVRSKHGDVDDIDYKNLPLPPPAQGYSGPATISSSVGSHKEPRFKQSALSGYQNRQKLNPFASSSSSSLSQSRAPPMRLDPPSISSQRIISPPTEMNKLPSIESVPSTKSDLDRSKEHESDDENGSDSSSSSSSSGSDDDDDEEMLLQQISAPETMATISAPATPPPPPPATYPTPPSKTSSLLDDLKMSDDSDDEMDFIMSRPPNSNSTWMTGSGNQHATFTQLHSDLQLSESSSDED